VQTHVLHCDDGNVTTGPLPTYVAPPLRLEADVQRRPMEGHGTGATRHYVDSVPLVDALEDKARAFFVGQLGTYPSATYPGFKYRKFFLYNSYAVRSHGRRSFRLDVRPLKNCITDSFPSLMAGTGDLTRRPGRTRPTVWCAAVPGVHPERSAEVCCVARIIVSTDAVPEAYSWFDVVLVQWHEPVRGPLQAPITCQKPSRVVARFSERPEPLAPADPETPDARSTAEFAYMLANGSRALAGGSLPIPVNAYHDHVPADVVALGNTFALVTPRCIVRRADVVPIFANHGDYGTLPGPVVNAQRPPFFRMFPRF
jgi:hypothetical protein